MALSLHNKQMIALIIVALLTFTVITMIVLSAVFQINIWQTFIPGETIMGGWN